MVTVAKQCGHELFYGRGERKLLSLLFSILMVVWRKLVKVFSV